MNGDGYADVIVGSMTYSNTQADEGAAFVYAGSSGGLAATPAWSAESNQANARYGVSVGTAGDVNADGAGDVIIGAYGYANPQAGEGRAYVYHGTPATGTTWLTRTLTYSYDGLHRLTDATYSTGESYVY